MVFIVWTPTLKGSEKYRPKRQRYLPYYRSFLEGTLNRHAYLIIAYAQPLMLQRLIEAIDDERNDIFVHIDKKASFDGSSLNTRHSTLHVYRSIDARWGDVSLVKVELLLMEAALKQDSYSYLHLLSDSDYPIKSQDYIHAACERLAGHEFIGFSEPSPNELKVKIQRYHLFPEDFRNRHLYKHILRKGWLTMQSLTGYRRHASMTFRKGHQWWSVTGGFALYVCQHREAILNTYHHTFCPDEVFIQSLCWDSPFKYNIDNAADEFIGCRRYIKWTDNTIEPITKDDIPSMVASPCWFGRKFSEEWSIEQIITQS